MLMRVPMSALIEVDYPTRGPYIDLPRVEEALRGAVQLYITDNITVYENADALPTPLKRLGVNGFGESGDPKGLYAKHGLDPAGIAASVRKFLSR